MREPNVAGRVSVIRMHRPLAGVLVFAAFVCTGCGGDGAPARDTRPAAQAESWESLSPATLARTEVAAARVGR